jgi:hypothetical protein
VAAALAAASAADDATPTPPAVRYTWNNCKCKVNWEEDGKKCSQACCNLDDDEVDYCFVEDKECEFADWGYCRAESMSTPGCTDYPPDWTDSDGDDCYSYSYNQFCTTSGGFGAEWDKDWGTFQSFTHAGQDASTSCCACGGGFKTFQGFDDNSCADAADWKDSDGDGCATYAQNFYCTPDGKQGNGWHEEWGTLEGFKSPNGVNALVACCACGGGTEGTFAGTQYTPKPNDDTAGVEVPDGAQWAIASGPCTKDSSGCITSPNYPNAYGNDEKCVIGVKVSPGSFIRSDPFSTEWGYDTLTVNGQIYSGTMGPNYVWPIGAIVWTSDFEQPSKGWRLCLEGTPNPRWYLTREASAGAALILVLGVVVAVACFCLCKKRKVTAPPIEHGEAEAQDED